MSDTAQVNEFNYIISKMKYADEAKRQKILKMITNVWNNLYETELYDCLRDNKQNVKLKEHNEDDLDEAKCLRYCLLEVYKSL